MLRRVNIMGSMNDINGLITQRPDGTWRAQVLVSGKKKTKLFPTRSKATRWLDEQNTTENVPTLTIGEYLPLWLETRKPAIRTKTAHHYASIIKNHIFPALARVHLDELTLRQVEDYYTQLKRRGIGVRTIQIIHNILHSSLEKATRYGYIQKNPTQGATLPRYHFDEMRVLSMKQVNVFLSEAKKYPSYALYHLAIVTGMRMGELLGLRWSDLDWEAGSIEIRRQRQYVPGEGITLVEPKTRSGKRTILLGQNTMQTLRQHKLEQEALQASGKWKDMDLIFPNSVGKPGDASNIRQEYNKILNNAGIPRIRFHDLRHTAASILLNHNIPVIVVSHILGHSKPSVTLDLYGHVLTDMQEEAATVMDKLIPSLQEEIHNSTNKL